MALSTFVKVGNIENLSDARYCSGMYVNLLGFNLEENHPDFVSPEKFKEITDWLSGLEYVAEFEFSHPQNILERIKNYPNISWIQIQEEAHLQMLVNTEFHLIYKAKIQNAKDIEGLVSKAQSYHDHAVTIILDAGAKEVEESWIPLIRQLSQKTKVLLGFGLNEDNVHEMIQATKVTGIALRGSKEIKPGYKDFDELADILETLEEGE